MSEGQTPRWTIAFDMTLRKPGCLVLQNILGATIPDDILELVFQPETWLHDLTLGMRLYEVDEDRLYMLENVCAAVEISEW